MNRILLLMALLGTMSAKAQFAITQSNMPAPGDVEYKAVDTLPSIPVPGAGGAAKSWDYAALKTGRYDTTEYLHPNQTLYSGSFPGANLVIGKDSLKGQQYAVSSANSLSLLGAAQKNLMFNSVIYIHFKPAFQVFHFPSNYNTSFKDSTKYKTTFYYGMNNVDSIRSTSRIITSGSYDAYGSLITPKGTFPQTMRQFRMQDSYDTVEVYTKVLGKMMWQTIQKGKKRTNTYTWFAEGNHYSLLEIATDSANKKVVSTAFNAGHISSGISKIGSVRTSVYPNPANEIITLQLYKPGKVKVLLNDVLGRKMDEYETAESTVKISTTAYPNGLYIYHLIKDDQKISEGKFIVCH